MKKRFIIFLLNLLSFSLLAQSPYRLHVAREAAWLGGGGVVLSASYLLHARTPGFTPDQVAALDASRVPRFDRYALHHYSRSAQRASDIAVFSSVALPLLLLADRNIRHDAPKLTVIAGEVFLVNMALTALTKELVHRPRPFNYNPDVPLSEKLKPRARRSFFSGHTSTTAMVTFATAKIWTDYHPDSGWKPAVWIAATAIPATVGFLRMQGGKHYLSDVAVGLLVGAATGILVPQWHKTSN